MNSIESMISQVVERVVRRVLREELERRDEPTAGPAFLSIAEAAEFASVSKGTVRNWIAAGHLTACKAGQIVRVRRTELERVLEPQTAEGVVDLRSAALDILNR